MDISKKVNSLLENPQYKGKGQNEIADEIGISHSVFSRIKSGASKDPSATTIYAIAKYFGVSADWLLGLPSPNTQEMSDLTAAELIGCSRETLESLKEIFGAKSYKTKSGIVIDTEKSVTRSNIAQLFLIAAADSDDVDFTNFFQKFADNVLLRIETDVIKKKKEQLLENIRQQLSPQSRIDSHESFISLSTKHPEDFDIFHSYDEDIQKIFSALASAIDQRDASEYRLQKSLAELLKAISIKWVEKKDGDTWQA